MTVTLPTELWRNICKQACLCWRLPIFTPRLQGTIFGTTGLNFRVRYGNGWTPCVINTNFFKSFRTFIYWQTHTLGTDIHLLQKYRERIYLTSFQMLYALWWLVRESTKSYTLDGSHHRCSPLCAKNSSLNCFLNAQTLSGSIPQTESHYISNIFSDVIRFLVTRAGIEPALPAWEAGVLTAWPTSHVLIYKGLNSQAPCVSLGAPSGARTRDTLIKSQVLYQLS